jgi:hypothetical protein
MARGRVSPRILIHSRPSNKRWQHSERRNGRFRFPKIWNCAPTDGVRLGARLSLPGAATNCAAGPARGNRNAVGADGCRYRRFDNSIFSRLGAHRSALNKRGASRRFGQLTTMLSRDINKDYEPSLRVVRRFCGITVFFVCWAAARHWPHPVYYLSSMLKVSFVVCLAFAMFRRERFADVNLNYWDEGLAYIATAVFLDCFEAR